MRSRFPTLLALVLACAPRVHAQSPTQVEALAPVLMAEDRRVLDLGVYSRALNDPDLAVRRYAVISAGRIGDARAVALLVPFLADLDSIVVANTFFALGLLRDSSAVAPIAARIRSTDALSGSALGEASTALARIGGDAAATFLRSVLNGASDIAPQRQQYLVPNALVDGWQLGAKTPTDAMLHFATDTSADLRWRALYSLGRLRASGSGTLLLRAMRDQTAIIRETAARSLTKRFADTTALATSAVKLELLRGITDDVPGVRVSALNSLATFGDSLNAGKVIPLLTDEDLNVRVAAATALGDLKGAVATKALDALFDRRDASWAQRRAALAALAHADTAVLTHRASQWLASADFRDRIAAIQAIASTRTTDRTAMRNALGDPDPRVQAAAIGAWRGMRGDSSVYPIARERLHNGNAMVRAAAASALGAGATPGDLDALVTAWGAAQSDLTSDGRLAVFGTIHGLVRRHPELLGALDDPSHRMFLQPPHDPLLREEAAKSWPEISARWGARAPINTDKTLDDYRGIVKTLLFADTDPHVFVEVAGKGQIDIELLPHESPLTVANFLRLVDRHYFDGNVWHRVVPDFVVQDGDPTGTGDGGPGWSIRDEINRERYIIPMAGMALSGPDTGGSQWFINLSPQPHLDGHYAIFGKVNGSYGPLMRVVQGDQIRSIHR